MPPLRQTNDPDGAAPTTDTQHDDQDWVDAALDCSSGTAELRSELNRDVGLGEIRDDFVGWAGSFVQFAAGLFMRALRASV